MLHVAEPYVGRCVSLGYTQLLIVCVFVCLFASEINALMYFRVSVYVASWKVCGVGGFRAANCICSAAFVRLCVSDRPRPVRS